MRIQSMLASTALAAALVAASAPASATPILGKANLSFGLVSISFGEIDWNPPLNPGLDVVPTYGGFLTSDLANTGSFKVGLPGITGGLVQDMSANPADANHVPIGPGFTSSFLFFAAQPGWKFDATFLAPGDFGSPYKLTELGGNVSATISLKGVACDTEGDLTCDPTDDKTLWTGIFSAQYTNTSIAEMQAILLSGGTLDDNTWSGTIEVPEPSMIALMGLALAGLGGVTAARRRRSS